MSDRHRPGQSADQRYQELTRAWRRRLWPLFLGWLAIAFVLIVTAYLIGDEWSASVGILGGVFLGSLIWALLSPPDRIDNWYWGSQGERHTGRVLRHLSAADWRVWHDLQREDGSNIDHVVIGAPGVFLLDSKNLSGLISVDGAGLNTQWLEDSEFTQVSRATHHKVAGASAELKERIQAATGVSVWVQPIVVLWGRFEQGMVRSDNIVFVHGNELVRCLLGSAPATREFDGAKIASFLDQASRRRLPARKRAESVPSSKDQ